MEVAAETSTRSPAASPARRSRPATRPPAAASSPRDTQPRPSAQSAGRSGPVPASCCARPAGRLPGGEEIEAQSIPRAGGPARGVRGLEPVPPVVGFM